MPTIPAPNINFNQATQQIIAGFYRLDPATMPAGIVNKVVNEYYVASGGPDPGTATASEKNKWFVRKLRDASVLWPIQHARRKASEAGAVTTADAAFATEFEPPSDG